MKAMKRGLLACYVILGSLCGSYGGFAQERFRYEPLIVQLSGRVIVEAHYGQPNFGQTPQTDKKENVTILDIDTPIAVEADGTSSINKDAFSDVSRVQLIDSRKLNLFALAGRHIRVLGNLFEKQNGHYTDVLMNADRVVLLD